MIAMAAAAAIVVIAVVIGVAIVATSGDSSGASSAPPAAVTAPPSARPGRVNVVLGDLWVKPANATVPAGRTRFVVRNEGGSVHDLMIERMPIKFMAANRPDEMAAQGGVESLSSGDSASTMIVLRPGRYELFCSVSTHFAGGQHTELTVTAPQSPTRG